MADLIDNQATWEADPLKAFQAFLASEEYHKLSKRPGYLDEHGNPKFESVSQKSLEVYSLMFGKYLRWLADQKPPIKLANVTAADIRMFLDHQGKDTRGRKPNSLIRRRYLRLLERVYVRLNADPNPASQVLRTSDRSEQGRDKPKVFLSDEQQALFMQNLPKAEPFDPKEKGASWKKRRDRAMLAMMLGAGLKVSEVIELKIKDIGMPDVDGSITITVKRGTIAPLHKTILRPFAVPHVVEWINERKIRNIPGDYLFPPSLSGRGTIKSKKMKMETSAKEAETLDKATVYRKAQAAFAAAGIDVDRKGGRTLRNTFAVLGLAEGKSLSEMREHLGHWSVEATQKYSVVKRKYRSAKKKNLATVAAGKE